MNRFGRFGTDDPFLHEEAIRPIEVLCTPLARTYRFDMIYLATPSVMLYEARIGSKLRGRGSLPPNVLTLCIPVRFPPGITFGKTPLRDSGMPCSIGGIQDVVFVRGQTHYILMIKLELLQRYLSVDNFDTLERTATSLFLPSSSVYLKKFANWLGHILHEAIVHPHILHFPEAVRSFEEDMVNHLAETIECRPSIPLVDRPLNRSRGIDRVLDYLHARPLAGITLPQLCDVAAVSQRTLERAFQDNFELSARDYPKLRRFHAVRRCLMGASKSETTVANIAYQNGFYELGRFAVGYARLFGERPSETLGRPFPEPRAVLIQT